ncbi:ribosome small subunit-dependent GTPase A [Zhaonella formicivorans]|uniref:ribosome small subunit-dependent GTPase A n=1 Tax=Zhaonella formicivorans TaxID=2528593 RepID=UPI001D12D7C1|nr:ribosome small subunit-dependent GTPase A [Zhaonella formicivorans]
MLLEGIILRGYSGFYYVWAEDVTYECSLRGRYRLKMQDFLPGDRVKILLVEGQNKGVIEEVLPRQTELVRPPVANVTQVVIVMALQSPDPDLVLLDRLLILAQEAGIRPVISFNKLDLAPEEVVADLNNLYTGLGYKVILTSAKKGIGIIELKQELQGEVTVFAGPSGAGKSSLLNAVQPGLQLKTGEVGEKSRRGKHTTRHVALMPMENGGFVADAPGFSRLYLPELKREELAFYFPDFACFRNMCKFNTCLHHSEPQCAVRAALDKGLIDPRRYEHYIAFLQEVIAKERSF